jgi:divalent metal cation (Fe/Co/Zn/Cd) transporter
MDSLIMAVSVIAYYFVSSHLLNVTRRIDSVALLADAI